MALGRLKNKAALDALLAAHKNSVTRGAAIMALAQTPDLKALDAYLDGLTNPDVKIRESARQALRAIRKEARPIVEKRANPPELAKELRLIYGSEIAAAATPEDYLRHGLAEKGDPVQGRKTFATICVQCHTIGAEGGKVGPDLTTAGAQFPRRELAESILYPSKAVREGYQAMNVETKDGGLLSGLLKAETAEELTLVDSAAQLQRIPKNQIASRKLSELSLMPEGIHAALSLAEFADLLAYLE